RRMPHPTHRDCPTRPRLVAGSVVKRYRVAMLRLALFALIALSACQTPPPEATVDAWQPVRFLTGCWRSQDGSESSLETWTPPHGDAMYGQNRSMNAGRMVFFELLTIARQGDSFVYIAQPRGGKPTEFAMTSSKTGADGTSVTFANPQHDFPIRIRYTLHAQGTLSARVDDGTDTVKHLTFEWQPVR